MKNLIGNLKYLYKVSRPRFWVYIFGPAILGILISINSLADFNQLNVILHLLYFLYPANLLIYGINDISDGDTDSFNPKKGKYEVKHQTSQTTFLLGAILVSNLPFLVFFVINSSLLYNLSILGFLFFSIQYSAKPIRAKSKPFIDGIFNVLYVFPAISSLYLIQPSLPKEAFPILLAGTFWCMAMHAFSAIPDIEADKKAQLKTTAVLLRENKTFIYCLLLYLASFILVLTTTNISLALPLSVYPVITLYTYFHKSKTFKIYKYFPYINAFMGFLITIQLLIKLIP